MQQRQKRIKTIQTFFMLALVCSLFFHTAHPAQGFLALERYLPRLDFNHLLIRQIDKPRWKIGYRFAEVCSDEFREREDTLKKMIVNILHAWLQPLRERYSERKFTAEFIFVRQPDSKELNEEDRETARGLDLRITFMCTRELGSFALVLHGVPPEAFIGLDEKVSDDIIAFDLSHELGHAMGMSDTYIVNRGDKSTGGMNWTKGKQPSSLMSGLVNDKPPDYLGEDDINGIIWLYKYVYEDLPADDCFFPDYVYEEETRGCRPKYPVIFEVKHGAANFVNSILHDDPTRDVNERDAEGNTALHHAVLRDSREIVEELLKHANIQVKTLDRHGRSPAKLARELERLQLAEMIEAHPSAQLPPHAVARPWTLATTWGAVKRKR